MKKSNINVLQECLKQLPNDVNIGMGMDTTSNVVYTFISFPKERFSEESVIERIKLLDKYHTKVLNAVIGYFYSDDRCYLIQEQQNVVAFIGDFWDNIASNINMEGLEMYKDCAMQYIYSLAYILNFFNKNDLGAALNGYQLASYHDQFEPCFTGLGFPEIFGESKSSSNNEQYFKDFCKKIDPSLKQIPTIEDIINNSITLEGSPEKRSEILKLCLAEDQQRNESKNHDDDTLFDSSKKEDESKNENSSSNEKNESKNNDDNSTNEDNESKSDDNKSENDDISKKENESSNEEEDENQSNSKYRFSKLNIIQECVKQLPKDVKVGMCIDSSKNVGYSFLSFPKKRFSENSIIERIELLNQYKTKALNTVVGYYISNDRCYLIQEQQTAISFISDFWGDIAEKLEMQGMETYKDSAMQFIYALAYILHHFNEYDIGAARTGYELASYHDQFEPCFCGLGFPEIFDETKSSSNNEKYFEEFCKAINSRMKRIPTIEDVVNGKAKIKGSPEKKSEILFILTGEKHDDEQNDEESDPTTKFENDHIMICEECEKELPNDVAIGIGIDQSDNSQYYLISCPEDRISRELISERIPLLNQYKTKALNAIIGYFYENGRCYLIEEQPYITSFINEYWGDVRDDINKKSFQDKRDIAMQYIYSLAYILKHFNDIGIGAALTGYELASYRDSHEPCFTALGFPEIFDETKSSSDNEQYFQEFCKEMNPKMKEIPTIDDVFSGKVRIRGTIKKRSEILYILTGKRIKENRKEEEEEEEVNEEIQNAKNQIYELVDCEESILTDPCFKEPYYHDEESHIYEMPTVFETNEYINDGSLDFIETGFEDRKSKSIQSIGSEFFNGNICKQECILHQTPNDPISIENEKLVITNVNCITIPYCMHHKKNKFAYMMDGDIKPLIDEYDLSSKSDYYIMMFMSFLYSLHQSGFLYLRRDFRNIFLSRGIFICGFDTCMKIGSDKCTSEMKDWDEEPTELTDCICLGAFVYYILTKKNLFKDDPKVNREKFKKGIKIPAKDIGKKRAKMIQNLLSPDPNVRKTVQWIDLIRDWSVDNDAVILPFLGDYYFKNEGYRIYINDYSFESTNHQIFIRGSIPEADGYMTRTGPSLGCQIKHLFSSSIGFGGEQIDYRIEGSKKGSFYMNKGNVSMTIFLPKGETEVQWDEENGIVVAFPEFAVKMHPDGSLLFPDGKFRKKIEKGNLIIEGQGLKITHGGSFLEFKSDGFTFKMINSESWEIKAPLTYVKYSPQEIFMKIADNWLKYSDARLEIGYRGFRVLLTDQTFQIKNSFMELCRDSENKCRFRILNKELIPKELENFPCETDFFDIPELEMPSVPMQTKKADQNRGTNNDSKPTTAEERAIPKNQDIQLINRDGFDELYEKMKNADSKIIVIDDVNEPEKQQDEPKKSKKKKEKEKSTKNQKQKQDENQNDNDDENLDLPLMENASTENRVSQEELPQDFAAAQAISKINKLLEAGESIAFFTSAKIINFLKPKRVRKIVITSAGRIFFTNIGGDGILGTIQTNKKSHADLNGCDVKVYGSKKTFHFVFENKEEGEKFVDKFSQSIA